MLAYFLFASMDFPMTSLFLCFFFSVSLPIVLDRDVAQSVLSWLINPADGPVFTVSNVLDKKFSRKPPPPFITSTLQQVHLNNYIRICIYMYMQKVCIVINTYI